MLKVFLDTNIYLNFYHYHDDDIEELRKLIVLIDEGKLILFLTEQVKNEFLRNREAKINDALKTLMETKTENFPNLIKNLDEFKRLNEARKSFNESKKKIITDLSGKIDNFELEADRVIGELFTKSTNYQITDDILVKAKKRFDLGNPPGKNGSYGDSINWEILLENSVVNENLYFVGMDKDFKSLRDENKFNPFLSREWKNKKNSQILYFKSLSSFFRETFPGIQLSTDLDRQLRIDNFINSYSFKNAHFNIHRLKLIFPIRLDEYEKIIDHMLTNNQLYWVSNDEGLNPLFHEIIDKYFNTLDLGKQAEIIEKYGDNGGKIQIAPLF